MRFEAMLFQLTDEVLVGPGLGEQQEADDNRQDFAHSRDCRESSIEMRSTGARQSKPVVALTAPKCLMSDTKQSTPATNQMAAMSNDAEGQSQLRGSPYPDR